MASNKAFLALVRATRENLGQPTQPPREQVRELNAEALELERERQALRAPWWVRLLRWLRFGRSDR